MPGSWNEIKTELFADCKIFRVHKSTRESEMTGQQFDFFTLEGTNWVNVIPVTDDGHVVMVRQYRHGIREFTLEVPGGALHHEEDPIEGGLREMEEETGYVCREAVLIGKSFPNPAIQSNTCFYVLAEGCKLEKPQNLDQAEEVDVELIPVSDIQELIGKGIINHALVINAFYYFGLVKKGKI